MLVDVFGQSQHENAHLFCVGQPNAGKTVALSCLALRHATAGAQVIYLDPIGTCRLLCDAVGPAAAFYEVDTGGSINILDRASAHLGTQRAAIERRLGIVLGRPDYGAGTLGAKVGLKPRELSNFEVGAIDQCLPALYGDPERTPVLGDLVGELRRRRAAPGLVASDPLLVEAGERLASEISAVLLGARGALLNAPTTIRFDYRAPVIGSSLARVVTADRGLMPLLYDLLLSEFDRYVRTLPPSAPPVIFVVDEFGYLAVTPEFEAAVALNIKAYRNFRAFMWVADRDASTFFGADGQGSRDEQRIAGNCFIKLFFRQEAQGATLIGAAYPEQLALEHVQSIRTAPQDHLLALFGDDVQPLVFQTSNVERAYFCTPPPPCQATAS